MSDWAEYAEALRKIAAARETASRRQEQLMSERASRVAAATAAVSAVAKQREQMQRQLASLEPVSIGDGPRAEIAMAPVSSFEDVARAISQLREWLADAGESLAEARRREALARRRLLCGGLLVLAVVPMVVIVIGGPWWLGLIVPAALYGFFRMK